MNITLEDLVTEWNSTQCQSVFVTILERLESTIGYYCFKNKKTSAQEDLKQEAHIAIMEACKTYDFDKPRASFYTFACMYIKCALFKFRRLDRTIPLGSKSYHTSNLYGSEVPTSHSSIQKLVDKRGCKYSTALSYALNSRPQRMVHEDFTIHSSSVEDNVLLQEGLKRIDNLLDGFTNSPKNKEIYKLRILWGEQYGEISEKYNISKQRVQQIVSELDGKIRKAL